MKIIKEQFDKIPKYISWEGKGSNMRLTGASSLDRISYYRDAGKWGTEAFMIDDKVFSYPNKEMPWLSEKELIPCTEEEWRNDSQGYVDEINAITWEEKLESNRRFKELENQIPY